MYANRLRHDDFLNLFTAAGHEVLDVEARLDTDVLHRLKEGTVVLNERFREKNTDILATTGALIVTAQRAV